MANDRKKSSKRSINTLRGVSSGTNNIATNDSGKRNQEKKKIESLEFFNAFLFYLEANAISCTTRERYENKRFGAI